MDACQRSYSRKALEKLVSMLPVDGYFILIGILAGLFIPLQRTHGTDFKLIVVGLGFVVVGSGYICSKIEKLVFGSVVTKGSVVSYLKHHLHVVRNTPDAKVLWWLLVFSLILHGLIGVLISQAILVLFR